MDAVTRSSELFALGYNCCQAVVGGVAESHGLDSGPCIKCAVAFGAGIARTGETCGAVTGALMAIGVLTSDPQDPSAKLAVYPRAQDFMARFREKHASLLCRDLVGCDIATPEGAQRMKELNLHQTICAGLVKDAVAIVEQMLTE